MSLDRIEGLRRALVAAPDNHALRLLLAETLDAAGRPAEALPEYEALLGAEALPPEGLLRAGHLAVEHRRLDLAGAVVRAARRAGVVEGVAELERRVDEGLSDQGVLKLVRSGPETSGEDAGAGLLEREEQITFADVGGLTEVKKAINRTIVLPFQRPELYERYGRRVGGGVLLYGPPGCRKTMVARATAGECGVPFFNVRIEQILDPYVGVSEGNLHDAFVHARAHAPCVLFFDELDAIAFARRKHIGQAVRALVDQLLQEFDAIGADNRDMLILAATNAPWDVDEALKRPGRFDRLLFVPPPDEEARVRILELHLATPSGLDLRSIARATALYSGADLRGLVEAAIDDVIDEALESGGEPPLMTEHLLRALDRFRTSTAAWLATARNYVEFANEGGRYDDVAAFLRSPEGRGARR